MIDEMIETLASEGESLEMTDRVRRAIVSALRGLSSFGAEQQLYLSLAADSEERLTVDLDSLFARKIEQVNQQRGLTMIFEKRERSSIRGLDAMLRFFDQIMRDENFERPAAILHLDEIEKSMAGSGNSGVGDSSGVTQDQLKVTLETIEEKGWEGIMPVGPPGVGKTLLATTIAGIYGIPYLRLDLGDCKGSLVGESERYIRLALETAERISAGRCFVVATCNKIDSLPSEFLSRFDAGVWFFDLPDRKSREQIFDLYLSKFEIDETPSDDLLDESLSGREIRNLCRRAKRNGISLSEARLLLSPTYISSAADLEAKRKQASGRFLDAERGGTYSAQTSRVEESKSARKVSIRGRE
jgi:adenylate kinase family enzyme